MIGLRGRAPRGQRLVAAVPHGHWKTSTFTTVLNAAPARPFETALPGLVDILVVNAIEAEMLGGGRVSDLRTAAAATALGARFGVVVVTAGGDGVAAHDRSGQDVSRQRCRSRSPARTVRGTASWERCRPGWRRATPWPPR